MLSPVKADSYVACVWLNVPSIGTFTEFTRHSGPSCRMLIPHQGLYSERKEALSLRYARIKQLVVAGAWPAPVVYLFAHGGESHLHRRQLPAPDLIRFNPNVPAYSLDFTGVSPRHPSRYQPGTWSELPHLSRVWQRGRGRLDPAALLSPYTTPELSRRVREAGYPIGPANIDEHEAIAATQAAIWFLTNGLALDTGPLNVPDAVHRARGPVITVEFDGEPQLGGYSV